MTTTQRTLLFRRDDLSIAIPERDWEAIVSFLNSLGFDTAVFFTPPISKIACIPADEAKRLAVAARLIMEETIKDPLAAYSRINFDMGKFAELEVMASEGAFQIRNDQ